MVSRQAKQSTRMRHFSTLAGRLESPPHDEKFHVRFKSILSYDNQFYRYWAIFISFAALGLVGAFAATLFKPAHWLITQQPDSPVFYANLAMLICLALLQVFIIVGTISATRATLKARDPIPMQPPKNLRVAFVITRAPGEPVAMVKKTLQAALKVRYRRGTVDVWLLDETRDPDLIQLCEEIGVHYFSRKDVPRWNTTKQIPHPLVKRLLAKLHIIKRPHVLNPEETNPVYAARSKHGNFNAWGDHLTEQGLQYDILAGVDTDQVPEPNYLERLLGYFRDEDVAYVVGPQVYGNYHPGLSGLVARWAESQASFFQSTIQRAGNASGTPMFVGTNYAVRSLALHQVNGFQPCITEDMATGLAIHAQRNPQTGNRWKSVYTPDVLAVGEGPAHWAPFFTQQWRWAAGTFDTWQHAVSKRIFKLSPSAIIHYFLILTYYPMAALTWFFAVLSSMIYLTTGATAIQAPWGEFIALYLMSLVMQLSLYFWNRRYNVSPHEQGGSYGVAGMAMSTLTAPVYLSALYGIARGKKPHFVVTVKGSSKNPDWFPAFKSHLQWAGVLIAGIIFGALNKHDHPAMLIWVGGLLVICFTPFVLGMYLALPLKIKKTKKKLENQPLVPQGDTL